MQEAKQKTKQASGFLSPLACLLRFLRSNEGEASGAKTPSQRCELLFYRHAQQG
jgi:hypothetical protein